MCTPQGRVHYVLSGGVGNVTTCGRLHDDPQFLFVVAFVDCFREVSGHVHRYGAGAARRLDHLAQSLVICHSMNTSTDFQKKKEKKHLAARDQVTGDPTLPPTTIGYTLRSLIGVWNSGGARRLMCKGVSLLIRLPIFHRTNLAMPYLY